MTVAIFFQKRSSVIEKNRSTELATILLSDNDQNAVDKGHILAELYARFNELSHSALLGKLKALKLLVILIIGLLVIFLVGSNFFYVKIVSENV